MSGMVLVGWLQAQAVNLPPIEEVIQWAFYGVIGWAALRMESTGRKVAWMTGAMVTQETLAAAAGKMRDDFTAVLTNHQDDANKVLETARDDTKEELVAMESRLTKRLERIEDRRRGAR